MHKHNLVLLPGLLNDARLWQPQVDAFAEIANSTVADLTGANSIMALAERVLAQAPAGKFALAGLSMGGYVALEIIRQAPERVMALALLDTNARADSPEATEGRKKLMQQAESDFESVLDTLLSKQLHPAHVKNTELVAVIKAMGVELGTQVFFDQQKAIMGRIDSRATLQNIHCPTLILCGRDDLITPVAIHEEMHAAIKGSTLVVIDECGHLSTLEQPVAVTTAMREWLMSLKN